MIAFWMICAMLVAGALTFVLPPLLRHVPSSRRHGMEEANLEVYRERLAEMELELRHGAVAREQFDLDRDELEQRLLEDLPTDATGSVAHSLVVSRRVPIALAAGLPVMALFLYLKVGNPGMLSAAAAQMPANVRSALDKARQEPGNFDAQVKAAEFYYQIQRYDEARDLLLKANQLQPDDYATMVNLGLVSAEGGHLEVAEKWYRMALARQPDDTRVLTDYCDVLIMQGKSDAARDVVALLTWIDPANPDLPRLHSGLRGPQ